MSVQTGARNYLLKEKYMFPTPLYFNKSHLVVCSYQKHLGVFLDKKLNFQHHIKGIGVIKKLNHVLLRNALLTIYKSFERPHLDYGNTLYHHLNNESMNSKLESVQCSL